MDRLYHKYKNYQSVPIVSSVIKWEKFPFPVMKEKDKARWFIYVGDTDFFSKPRKRYLISTTTTVFLNRPSFFFKKSKYTFFTANCFLYYNEHIYDFSDDQLNNPEIKVMGKIDEEDLKQIYNGICTSQYVQKVVKQDIHFSFNSFGITGLKRP